MIEVTCAVIRNEENEVLIVQRGEATDHPFKWEFPGGKLNTGETEEDCILREVDEELSMNIVICGRLSAVEYDYGHKQIKLIPFICDTLDELPFLSEHYAFKWIQSEELSSVDFSEADVLVAREYLETTVSLINPLIPGAPLSAEESSDDTDLQSMVYRMMSMKEAEWVAMSAIENPGIFQKLLEYSYSSEPKLAFRASWTLTKVCDKFPEMIIPFISKMIDSLDKIKNESTLRSFLRIISLSDMAIIDTRQHGKLADFCFRMLNSGFSAIAIKAYSMEILYRLSVVYPDLATELGTSIRILLEDASAGITARGKHILKKISEIPINPKSSQK